MCSPPVLSLLKRATGLSRPYDWLARQDVLAGCYFAAAGSKLSRTVSSGRKACTEVELRRLARHSVAPARQRYRAQAPSFPRFERAERARTSFAGTRRHLCRPCHRLCRVRPRSRLDHDHLDRAHPRQRKNCLPADTDLCRCQPAQSQRGPSYPSQAWSAPFLFSEVISAPSSSEAG